MNNRKCILEVDDRLFCDEAVLKTSYLFTDDFYIMPTYKDSHIISISIEPKINKDITNVDKHFCNELISQMVRYQLSKANKTMKELILGRALYSTCLDISEPDSFNDNAPSCNYSLDDIAVSWFDINEK